MCGRFVLLADLSRVVETFQIEVVRCDYEKEPLFFIRLREGPSEKKAPACGTVRLDGRFLLDEYDRINLNYCLTSSLLFIYNEIAMICQNCEAENSIYAAKCYRCGFPLGGKPKPKKHRLVALLLICIFAGMIFLNSSLIKKEITPWMVKGKRSYFISMGERHLASNDLPAAVAFYTKAINLGGSSARLYAQRGHAYYQLGEYDQAREDFSRAIEMVPQEGKYLLSRGKTYLMLKQKAAAREDLTVAAKAGNLEAQALLVTMANDHSK